MSHNPTMSAGDVDKQHECTHYVTSRWNANVYSTCTLIFGLFNLFIDLLYWAFQQATYIFWQIQPWSLWHLSKVPDRFSRINCDTDIGRFVLKNWAKKLRIVILNWRTINNSNFRMLKASRILATIMTQEGVAKAGQINRKWLPFDLCCHTRLLLLQMKLHVY